jgi:hypothetical protein
MRLRALIPAAIVALVPVAAPATVPYLKIVIDSAFPGSSYPVDLRLADVDGDFNVDLVVPCVDYVSTNDRLYVYLNDGAQNFTRSVIDSTVAQPFRIEAGDIDGDVDTDLVLGNDNALYLYLNAGGGSFSRTTLDPLIGNVREIQMVDLDSDTDVDVVVLANTGVFWEENDGSESFTRRTVDAIDISDFALAVADLDGDGDLDIASSVYDTATDNSWCVEYRADPGPVFVRSVFDVHQVAIRYLGAQYMDPDALVDLVACEDASNRVMWYPGDGTPALAVVGTNFVQAPRRAAVSDVDNDTDPDVVVVGGNSTIGEVVYYENDGFLSFVKRAIDSTAGNRVALSVLDIDKSRTDDFFVVNNLPHQVVMYLAPDVGSAVHPSPDGPATLGPNFPNPFNPATTIEFELAADADVVLDVVSSAGEKVRALVHDRLDAGPHVVRWDGRNDRGEGVGSGVYFCRLRVDGRTLARKMVVLK